MIRLSLPYPPSANRLWRAVNGRNIKSAEYRAWEGEGAGWLWQGQLRSDHAPLTGPYAITIDVDRPDRRKRDLGNLEKPVSDLLVSAGVIADDSDAQSITLRWTDKAPAKPASVHVTLEAAPCSA